jgi:multidrug efflux pump subunit AcrA (membrane-fusion protein)
MGVKVTFHRDAEAGDAAPRAAQPTTLVPKAAIRSEGGATYVFVVDKGVVDRRAVKTGGIDGDRVEVLAGLRAGEQVVVSPPEGLAAGAPVRIKGVG